MLNGALRGTNAMTRGMEASASIKHQARLQLCGKSVHLLFTYICSTLELALQTKRKPATHFSGCVIFIRSLCNIRCLGTSSCQCKNVVSPRLALQSRVSLKLAKRCFQLGCTQSMPRDTTFLHGAFSCKIQRFCTEAILCSHFRPEKMFVKNGFLIQKDKNDNLIHLSSSASTLYGKLILYFSL